MKIHTKKEKRLRRHRRVRVKIRGTAEKPRLCVFISNRYIYAQLIDDAAGKTLISESSLKKKDEVDRDSSQCNAAVAEKIGALIAQKAIDSGVKEVVFDRSGYYYHGRVKAVAESARKAGLVF